MAKNRDHYFKVMPGDDSRLFQDVDVETEGFIARLRRVAHDCSPYGFLVDLRRRPYDAKKIATIARLTNPKTDMLIELVRVAQLLQTPVEFRADIASGSATMLTRQRLEIFDAMCAEVATAGTDLRGVLVVPSILEQYLIFEAATRFGKKGGNKALTLVRDIGGDPLSPPLTPPLKAPPKGGAITRGLKTQKSESEVRSQNQKSPSSLFEERERPLPRGRDETQPGGRMSWAAFTARAHEISVWQKRLGAVSTERFEADFEAEFQMPWGVWEAVKRRMEDSIPKPCADGHHVFEGVNSQCSYCPFTRVSNEESA